jgi:hypothetical protein
MQRLDLAAHSSHILMRCSTRRSTIRRATDFSNSACFRSAFHLQLRPARSRYHQFVTRYTLIEGFSHFVTSMTAPIAYNIAKHACLS